MPVDPDDEPLPPPGGDKGLPGPELAFENVVSAATQAVKTPANANTANLIDVVAIKKLKKTGAPVTQTASAGTATFHDSTLRFRAGKDGKLVTVTGTDSTKLTAGKAGDPILGPVNLGDISKAIILQKIWVNNKKIVDYVSLKFYRPAGNELTNNPTLTNQPYYEFFDAGNKSIGLYGANDGKEYTRSTTTTTTTASS